VDAILTNPPFGGMEEPGVESNFPAQFQTKETADLFLALIVHLLRDGGQGAIVLPDGSLFGEGVKTRLKEHLLERCNLHTVVRLPNGVFAPYTDINTNLLFFTKGAPTREVWYFEHPLPEGYKKYTKTRPIRIEEFDGEKAWWHDRQESEHAWRVSFDEIKARGYNLDIKNPNSVDAAHGDPARLLADYRRLEAEIAAARAALKAELMAALERTPHVP
jgi:type I restriction enzyme M protein